MRKIPTFLVVPVVLALILVGFPQRYDIAEAEYISEKVESLEKRIKRLEEKQRALEEEEKRRAVHLDKHISHMEEIIPRVIKGLEISAGATFILQGSQGLDSGTGEGDVFDGSFSADLEISADLGDGYFFLGIEGGSGNGLQDDELSSFHGVNADASDSSSSLEISEAWYEKKLFEGRLVLTFGKLDVTNYFDANEVANDETTQFLSPGFVNNPTVEFPDPGLGLRTGINLWDGGTLNAALQESDSDFENPVDRPFGMIEISENYELGETAGNLRVGFWVNGARHRKYGDPTEKTEKGWGISISADHSVSDRVTLFVRAGKRNEDVYEYDSSISLGASFKVPRWLGGKSEIGMAAGCAFLSNWYEKNISNPENEYIIELYDRIPIGEKASITPDFQLLWNASGDGDAAEIYVFGLRLQIFL